MKRLAVVPARGGSKRIPDKNVRPFCGRPMISYTLEAARESGLFDAIHVSTESDSVTAAATALGFPPEFPRPAALSDDTTPLMPVLRFVLEEYGRRGRGFDEVALLYACAPLVEAGDLRAAAAMAERVGGDKVVIGVAKFAVPVEWAYTRQDDGQLVPASPGTFQVRSQDLRPAYHDVGAFAFLPAARIVTDAPHDERDFYGYVLPRYKAVDIDDDEDWLLAEFLYRGRGAH